MRHVFASQRIENAENVARLLRDAGIETRVSNGRGWRGSIRGNFSYRDRATSAPPAQVWVVHSADYTQARELLREAGLLQASAAPGSAYATASMHGDRAATGKPRRAGSRARTGALLAVVAAVAVGYFGLRWSASNAPPAQNAASPVAVPSPIADASTIHRIETPPALAETLLLEALDAYPAGNACVAVDGNDPPADVVQRLQAAATGVQPTSACAASASLRLDVTDYRTDGSGTGTVRIERIDAESTAPVSRTVRIERTGTRWRVLGEADAQAPPNR